MKCTRCQGLMVEDHFMDFDGTIGHMWAIGYRCMNCGNLHDGVIEQHRLARPRLTPLLAGYKTDYPTGIDCEDVQSIALRAA